MTWSVDFGGDADLPVAGDHGQFIVCDCTASSWTDTTVRLSLRRERPVIDLGAWDRVVETGICIRGGALDVYGPESARRNWAHVGIPSDSYSLAVCGIGFDTTDEYGAAGSDTYTIWLWPGPVPPTRVLKDRRARAR